MFAKQTLSASLVAAIAAGGSSARAEPDPPVPPASDEVITHRSVRTGTFELGAGFSTDENFIALARISQTDLFRTGLQLALDARISSQQQLFQLTFLDPHIAGSDYSVGANLYADQRVLPGFTRKDTGGVVALTHQLTDHLRGFTGYRLHEVSVDLDNVARGEASPGPLVIGSVYSGLEYNSLDTPFLPRSGSRIGMQFEVADPRFGSDVELASTKAWAETHQPLGPFTLHVGGTVSVIGGPHGVPLSERYFLTSSRQIRGYTPGEVGPAGGGTFQAFGRAELEVPLFSSIQLSGHGFLDAGIIDGSGARSAGFGIVWRSPIGPLVFDWAFPLTGGPMQFVFGLGTMF